MDRTLRIEICREVKQALEKALLEYNEVWLSEADLIKTFPCFTKDWVRRYGYVLPRTRAIISDEEGHERQSSWMYAKYRIQRMIMNSKIEQLKVTKL